MNHSLKLAVVGNPISHSLSPQLHPQFAQQFAIDLHYSKICPTSKGFKRVLNDFFSIGGNGLNITAPFKNLALEYADIVTQRAHDSASVNTLIFSKEGIIGDSTDGMGFLRDLYAKQLDFAHKKAVLLGAGGVARCIASALLLDGFEVYLINRTQEKAVQLAEDLQHLGYIKVYQGESHIDLVVNSVSLNAERYLPSIYFHETAHAYDLNYGQKAEVFLTEAKRFTTQQYDGLGMLIEQGAESFGLWTGKHPDTSLVLL